ncbi:radical SAM protein [bacterium]|nr:radical SAM protein [bacterium]NIN92314.1 radical SAM protein [bacterium]NIO18436.1 radical SAM protein [bacterium]NIO73429.1 radical SAM protein [bacterium]
MHILKEIERNFKSYSQKELIRRILKLVPRASNSNLAIMLILARKLTVDLETKRKIGNLIEIFRSGHPSIELGKKLLTRPNKECVDKLVENFFINNLLMGSGKRQEIRLREGVGPPFFLVLSPTMRCNLNCRGCSTREYSIENDLPLETIDRIISEAKDLGIYFITTQGGEMFLRKDMYDVYEKHDDVYFQVYSNGILIDRKTAKKLADLGNVEVNLSVEGFKKETDSRRGKGVWKKIMEAMDNLREEGCIFGFSATMTRQNADALTSDEFIDLMADKGCYLGWYFQYIPIGMKPDLEMMPTPRQRNRLRQQVTRWRDSKEIFIGDFWNDGPHVEGCMAGRLFLHINNKGDVEPCTFVHFAVDNIHNKTLREAINSPFFKAIRRMQQAQDAPQAYSDNLLTPCMIIDQPWVLRELVNSYGARATDEGDDLLRGAIAEGLNSYSQEIHNIYDPIWKEKKKSARLTSENKKVVFMD